MSSDNVFKRGSGWGRSVFLKYDELTSQKEVYLKNDTLQIRCTVKYIKPTTCLKRKSNSSSSDSSAFTEPLPKILNIQQPENQLGSLSPLNNRSRSERSFDFHDIVLSVGGVEFPAHKWILSSASPQLSKLGKNIISYFSQH